MHLSLSVSKSAERRKGEKIKLELCTEVTSCPKWYTEETTALKPRLSVHSLRSRCRVEVLAAMMTVAAFSFVAIRLLTISALNHLKYCV